MFSIIYECVLSCILGGTCGPQAMHWSLIPLTFCALYVLAYLCSDTNKMTTVVTKWDKLPKRNQGRRILAHGI